MCTNERVTGHRFKGQIIAFGERELFRIELMKSCRGRKETDWLQGLSVGTVNRTQAHLLMTQAILYTARTARKLSKENAYAKECLSCGSLKSVDYVKRGARAWLIRTEHILGYQQSGAAQALTTSPRGGDDIHRWLHCSRVHWWMPWMHVGADPTGERRNHSETCRQVMEELMRATDHGRERRERADARLDTWTGEPVEDEVIATDTEDAATHMTSQTRRRTPTLHPA